MIPRAFAMFAMCITRYSLLPRLSRDVTRDTAEPVGVMNYDWAGLFSCSVDHFELSFAVNVTDISAVFSVLRPE